MRLINTLSLELEEFLGEVPPYAILSHTWEYEEVLFADMQNGTASSKQGYFKLARCCQKALEQGYAYAWIDTCCIDKSSSAELSEAINSMYRWYKLSGVCYAYLQDVTSAGDEAEIKDERCPLGLVEFLKSRWFTRGWTLQELLAPDMVEFYSHEWDEIGTKGSLAQEISSSTGIPPHVLRGVDPSMCCVAERMSWASSRKTTRLEDMAYSLLGLFDINMPLLYGEGNKAFSRLQEQILKQEEDYSIFSWTLRTTSENWLTGILASSPKDFAKSQPQKLELPDQYGRARDVSFIMSWTTMISSINPPSPLQRGAGLKPNLKFIFEKQCNQMSVRQISCPEALIPKRPPEIVGRSISISLPVFEFDPSNRAADISVIAWIYCEISGDLVCIALKPISDGKGGSTMYGRQPSKSFITVPKSRLSLFSLRQIMMPLQTDISRQVGSGLAQAGHLEGVLRIENWNMAQCSTRVLQAHPAERWTLDGFTFSRRDSFFIGEVLFECSYNHRTSRFWVQCGIEEGRAWCSLSEGSDVNSDSDPSDNTVYPFPRLHNLSDRVAEPSAHIKEAVLTAVIRSEPLRSNRSLIYLLHVGVYGVTASPPWVRLHLNSS